VGVVGARTRVAVGAMLSKEMAKEMVMEAKEACFQCGQGCR
jgi:hypothetical protein